MSEDTTTDEPDVLKRHEMWAYLGERAGKSVAKVHVYRDPNGDRRSFRKPIQGTHAIVGSLYDVIVSTDEQGSTFVHDATLTREKADDIAAIVLSNEIAAKELAQEALGRNLKRQNVIDDAIRPLVELAHGLKSPALKDALIAHVTRAIWRA